MIKHSITVSDVRLGMNKFFKQDGI